MLLRLLFASLLPSAIFAAPPDAVPRRSNVALDGDQQSVYLSPDITNVISRFQEALNGVNSGRETYDGRAADTSSPASTLTALLKILDRLQDVGSTTAQPATTVADDDQVTADNVSDTRNTTKNSTEVTKNVTQVQVTTPGIKGKTPEVKVTTPEVQVTTPEVMVESAKVEGEKESGDVEAGSLEDLTADNIEERYEAFVPSPELVEHVTNPPEYYINFDVNSQDPDEEIYAEPKVANFSSKTEEPEATTISGEELLKAKPFLGSLVNESIISEDDQSTVASIAISHSAAATAVVENATHGASVVNRSSCLRNGVRYASGQNVDQSEPCHFCVCVDGAISCYWKNCPPAPEGCADLEFDGVCSRSLYLCPIPVKGQPLPFDNNDVKRSSKRAAPQLSNSTNFRCEIVGVGYGVGEIVGVASDPCMECRCAVDSLYCSPKCCFQPAASAAASTAELDKNARADDPGWLPLLPNPLAHLRAEFQ